MYSATVHTLGFVFDRQRQALVFTGTLENGFAFEVAFPIGHVTMTFDREAAGMGYCGEPLLGSVDTVDSFLGAVEVMHRRETGTELGYVELGWFGSKLARSVSHAVSSVAKTVAKPVSTAVKAYVNTVKKVGQQAVKYAKAGIRSKYVGYALAGAAVAFPAIGAPALAAYGAANRALAAYEDARRGVKTAQQAVKTISSNAKALSHSRAPMARMALAGLQAAHR